MRPTPGGPFEVNEKVRRLRAHAAALRASAADATDDQSRNELLLAARECETLARELATDRGGHAEVTSWTATRGAKPTQTLH